MFTGRSKWRNWWFDGNASSLKRSPSDTQLLESLLDPHHFGVLEDYRVQGFNACRLGNKRHYDNGNHPGVENAGLKILQDFLKQVQEKKSFLFSTEGPVKDYLILAGVGINPMHAVPLPHQIHT